MTYRRTKLTYMVTFTTTILTFPSPSIEKCELAQGSNKTIVCNQVVPVLRYKDTATLYPPRKSEYLQENSLLWSTVCAIFAKLLITLASVYRYPLRSPKLKLDLQNRKIIFLLITITISLNNQIDKFAYRSDFETTILAYFPSKSLNYTAINFFSQNMSTLTIAKFTTSTRTDLTLQTCVKYFRVFTMCSAINPDCRYDNSTFKLFVIVYFWN